MRAGTQTTVAVSTIRTPLRHAVGLATLGALGGALVVTGLFLSLGGSTVVDTPASEPVFEAIAVDPIVPIAQRVPAERWPAEVAAEAAPGVAHLIVPGPTRARFGSGVMYRTDGYLLTSEDLVGDAAQVDVVLADGSRHAGTVLGSDPISGLATVKIDVGDTAAARLALLVPPPAVGDYAVVVRAKANNDYAMSTISALDVNVPVGQHQNLHGLIQLADGTPPGASGAGLVDHTGSVIGIVVDVDTEHGTYAVPIGYARKIAEDLSTDGVARHSWLGIRGIDIPAEANELNGQAAVRVQSVISDSPAHRAGLTQGAMVTAIGDTPITSMTELILELRRHVPGETVEVTAFIRGKKYLKTVELEARSVDQTT